MRKRLEQLAMLALTAGISVTSLAETLSERSGLAPAIDVSPIRLRAEIGVDYNMLTRSSSSISGMGIGGTIQYALTESAGLSAELSQAFSSSGLAAIYTRLGLSFDYALTGQLQASQERVRLTGETLYSADVAQPSSWVLQAGAAEYLVNGPGIVMPFSGLTAGLAYQTTFGSLPLSLGAQGARLTNGTQNFIALSFRVAYAVWLL